MVPLFIKTINTIPLTLSGKVDRKALPEPQLTKGQTFKPPGNAVEEKLTAVWAEVLAIQKDLISVDSNFFRLGGHSLKATLMIAKLRKELNVDLQLVEVFKKPTIKGLAEQVKNKKPELFISIALAEKKEYYSMSPAQKRLYLIHRLEPGGIGYNMPQVFPIEKPHRQKLENLVLHLIERHESLRTSFHMYEDRLYQQIHPLENLEFKIEEYQTKRGDGGQWGSRFVRPFELSRPPLFRVGMIKISSAD
ncbi:MAG: hypothetical protein GY757_06170, partial [bacterium]|nr:hypothetical protein [bacterium]